VTTLGGALIAARCGGAVLKGPGLGAGHELPEESPGRLAAPSWGRSAVPEGRRRRRHRHRRGGVTLDLSRCATPEDLSPLIAL